MTAVVADSIYLFHSMFNVLCTLLMLPFSQVLEQMVCRILPDAKVPEKEKELDEAVDDTRSDFE